MIYVDLNFIYILLILMILETFNKIRFIETKIFENNQKNFLFLIFFLSILASLVEIIGLGLIFPTIGLIISENFLDKYSEFNFLNLIINNFSKEKLIIYFFLLIIFVYVFKFIILLYNKYINSKLIFHLNNKISSKLFNSYLKSNYEYIINKSHSELIRNIIDQSISFSMGFVVSILNMSIEIFVLLFLTFFLLFFQFKITICIMLSLIIFSFIYLSLFKKKISQLGFARIELERHRFKYILDGLNGIKEIILFDKSNFFSDQLKSKNKELAKIGIKQSVYQIVPPLFFEFVTILIFSILVLILIFLKYSSEDILLILTLYGLAVLRLLPSFSKIVANYQNMSYHYPSVENVFKIINEITSIEIKFKNTEIKDISFNSYIKFKDVSFIYKNKNLIFKNLDFILSKNSKVGIVGRSGSGKSTLVALIMGLLSPSQGDIFVDGVKLEKKNIDSWKKKIGYVSQDTFLLEDSFAKNIAFGISDDKIDIKKVEYSAKIARINDFIISSVNGYETTLGERGCRISSGQKQRVGLARSIYIDPDIFIFDESTNALDQITETEILNDIYKNLKEKTIIYISHKKELINKYCEEIYNVENNFLSKIK